MYSSTAISTALQLVVVVIALGVIVVVAGISRSRVCASVDEGGVVVVGTL